MPAPAPSPGTRERLEAEIGSPTSVNMKYCPKTQYNADRLNEEKPFEKPDNEIEEEPHFINRKLLLQLLKIKDQDIIEELKICKVKVGN